MFSRHQGGITVCVWIYIEAGKSSVPFLWHYFSVIYFTNDIISIELKYLLFSGTLSDELPPSMQNEPGQNSASFLWFVSHLNLAMWNLNTDLSTNSSSHAVGEFQFDLLLIHTYQSTHMPINIWVNGLKTRRCSCFYDKVFQDRPAIPAERKLLHCFLPYS